MKLKKNIVIVIVEGGVIQNVMLKGSNTEIITIDYDSDDLEEPASVVWQEPEKFTCKLSNVNTGDSEAELFAHERLREIEEEMI